MADSNNSLHWMSFIYLKPLSVYSYFSLKTSLKVFRNRNDLLNSNLSGKAVINRMITINEDSQHISSRNSEPALHLFKSRGKNFATHIQRKMDWKQFSRVAQDKFCQKLVQTAIVKMQKLAKLEREKDLYQSKTSKMF